MHSDKYFCEKSGNSIIGNFRDVQDMVLNVRSFVTNNSTNTYFFRGQVYPWRLRSSIHRSNKIKEEITETYQFISWIKHNEYVCGEDVDDNVLMAIAQHYGYKTDFIDFTTDLDVAAYFSTDFKELNDLPNDAKGCIWCISLEEISVLQDIFLTEVRKGNIKDKEVIRKFIENPISPFFKYEFQGLSRINNQAGLFLWDYQGLFTARYFGAPDCVFDHTYPKAYTTDKVNEDFIYPSPNALEREIQRYIYTRNIQKTLQSKEYRKVIQKMHTVQIKPILNKYPGFEDMLEEISWEDDKWKEISDEHFPNNIVNHHKDVFLEKEDIYVWNLDNCIGIVMQFSEEYKTGKIVNYISENKILENIINEVIKTLFFYPYNDIQIAECLFYAIQYAKEALHLFKEKHENFWSGQLEKIVNYISINKVAEKVYGDEVYEIEIQDKMFVTSRCFVSQKFLSNMNKEYRIKQIEEVKKYAYSNCLKMPELINGVALIHMTTNPKKLFDFEDINILFVKYILPYQFAFRFKEGRIYLPSFLKSIGLA